MQGEGKDTSNDKGRIFITYIQSDCSEQCVARKKLRKHWGQCSHTSFMAFGWFYVEPGVGLGILMVPCQLGMSCDSVIAQNCFLKPKTTRAGLSEIPTTAQSPAMGFLHGGCMPTLGSYPRPHGFPPHDPLPALSAFLLLSQLSTVTHWIYL